jgi:uncharacterized protein (TIGR00251 family)
MRLSVHVKPRSSRSKILGYREGALEVAVQAPPVDGKANDELIELIADALDISRRCVSVVAGQTGRQKILEIDGMTEEQVREVFQAG